MRTALPRCPSNRGNPIDSDGRVVMQEMDQSTVRMLEQGGAWNWTKAAGVQTVKGLWVIFSLGSVCKNDRLSDRNLAGEISDRQFIGGSLLNSGVAMGSVLAGGGAANFVAQRGGNYILQGAAGGFASSFTDVAATRGGYWAMDIRYEGTWTGDGIQLATGTVLGTAFGGGTQLQQALRSGSGFPGQMTLGQVDNVLSQLQQVPPKAGVFDIIGHGNKNVINGLSADELASLLRQSSQYNGQNLRLLSCECGKGVNSLGSRLARRTWVAVEASPELIFPGGSGGFKLQNAVQLPSGEWLRVAAGSEMKVFSPFNLYMPLNWSPDEQH